MAKKAEKPPRTAGRPKSGNPMSEFVGLRLTRPLFDGAEKYLKANKLDDIPSAIRQMMRRVLEDDGHIPKE